MPVMSLLSVTKTLLRQKLSSGVSLRQLAADCGPDVDYEWLKKFNAGKIDDPSVNRIQALHDRLAALSSNAA